MKTMKSFIPVLLAFFVLPLAGCPDSAPPNNTNNVNNINNINNVINNINNTNNVNANAPVLGNLPATELSQWNQPDTFTAEATDADGDALTWSISGITCTFGVTVDATGIVSWTCEGPESCNVAVTVTDDGTPMLSDTEILTIDCENGSGPEITSVPTGDATENEPYVYIVTCTDADGDYPQISIDTTRDTCGGRMITFCDHCAHYEFTPAASMGGQSCHMAVQCSDGLLTVNQDNLLHVVDVNQAPVLTQSPPEPGYAGSTYFFWVGCEDADGEPVTVELGPNDTCGGTLTQNGPPGYYDYMFYVDYSMVDTTCVVEVTCSDGVQTVTESGEVALGQPPGTPLQATRIGGPGTDSARVVATDAAGNVLIAGQFFATVGVGPSTFSSLGGYDVFVAKLDAAGNFLWARQIGGSSMQIARAIATDGAGNVILAGEFQGTIDLGSGPLVCVGSTDSFLAKYDPSGNLIWAQRGGGSGTTTVAGLAIDAAGNLHLAGTFEGTAQFGAHNLVSAGGSDTFVAKFDPAGQSVWATRGGGSLSESCTGVAVDAAGAAVITGGFVGTATFGATPLTSAGLRDIFVARYDTSGNTLWAVRFGGSDVEEGSAVQITADGKIWVAGFFSGGVSFGSWPLTSMGSYDGFLAWLDGNGAVVLAHRFGGAGLDRVWSLALDPDDHPLLAGFFVGNASFGSFPVTSVIGGTDAFLAGCDSIGNFTWATSLGGAGSEEAYGVTTDPTGNLYTVGYFEETLLLGTLFLTSAGATDAFLIRHAY